jgi:ABC-2 type transport system ATP-binding protein
MPVRYRFFAYRAPVLEVAGLTRRFGDIVALDGLSLSVPDGQVVGFLGPNGSGKTTAMRTILGISAPDAGRVLWQGRDVTQADRLRFGYMPEERGLYPTMAVLEQLVYLGRLHGMDKATATSSAERWVERIGLGDRAGDKVEALSLGNQQRAQLAAALVHSPELLVLDEPFSGLDPVGVDTMAGVLAEAAAEGVGVLFSSHQLDLVEDVCESVAIVNRGRIVASGTVTDLATAGPVRLVVQVAGDREGAWARVLRGVTLSENDAGRVRLVLDSGTDPQAVLAAAQRSGPIERFSFERRRLSEVFRQAVAS